MDDGGSMAAEAAAQATWRLRLHGPAQLLAPDGTALARHAADALHCGNASNSGARACRSVGYLSANLQER